MKTLYLDCTRGAAGNMLCAALLELLEQPETFVAEFNSIGIPEVRMLPERKSSSSIAGSHVTMSINGRSEEDGDASHHHGRSLPEIAEIISSLKISAGLRQQIFDIYGILQNAEARVHGEKPEHIHFHELGSLDAIADISAVCMLMDRLAPELVVVSPVNVGSGNVQCAHGILPVPAPATAELLKGIPSFGDQEGVEKCTPTGAVLLKYFARGFGAQPEMTVEKTGYGIGSRVTAGLNCVRALLGDSGACQGDEICELRCNLDDMTGEAIGFAMELLMEAGALDVFTVPIGMKKSRPGVMLCCLCTTEDRQRMAQLLLRHTTSLGVRIDTMSRRLLQRQEITKNTPLGEVRMKLAEGKRKAEFEDLAKIARQNGLTLAEAAQLAENDGESLK